MIVGIAGEAGAGKDTVASLLSKYIKSTSVAQATPMKILGEGVFGFTQDQLYGPSESRNAPDGRYDLAQTWTDAGKRLLEYGRAWVAMVLPKLNEQQRDDAFYKLCGWFSNMAKQHGFDEVRNYFLVTIGPSILQSGFEGTACRTLTPRYMLQTVGTEYGRSIDADMWNDYAIYKCNAALSTPGGPDFAYVTDVRFRNECVGIRRAGGILINVRSPEQSNAAVEKAGVAGHVSEAELKSVPASWFAYRIVNDKKHGLEALDRLVERLAYRLTTDYTIFSTEDYQVVGN